MSGRAESGLSSGRRTEGRGSKSGSSSRRSLLVRFTTKNWIIDFVTRVVWLSYSAFTLETRHWLLTGLVLLSGSGRSGAVTQQASCGIGSSGGCVGNRLHC